MAILDSYIVVSPAYIKLGEDLSILQLVHEVGDEGKGVGIADGVFIDIAIVLTRAKSTVFLFDEEEGGSLW